MRMYAFPTTKPWLVKSPGYPVVSLRAELSRDELVQPLRIRLIPARLFLFLPRGKVGRITHHDHPDAVAAPDMAGLFDRLPDRFIMFILLVRNVEDHISVRGASQVRESFIDGRHVDGIERLDLEGHDLHVLAGQVAIGPYRGADKIRPRLLAACTPPALSCGYLDGQRLNLTFLRPERLQRGSDRRIELRFVDVGECGFTHHLGSCL
jgi:hypothetical protein